MPRDQVPGKVGHPGAGLFRRASGSYSSPRGATTGATHGASRVKELYTNIKRVECRMIHLPKAISSVAPILA